MPQLELASYPSQIFWLAVSFTLLYFLFARVILPRFAKIQHQRREATIGKREQAEAAAKRAEAALARYEETLAQSKAEAQKEAQALKQATDQMLHKKSEGAKGEIEAKIKQAEDEIARLLIASKGESLKAAAFAAIDIARKIAAVEISEASARQAVEAVRAERGRQ